MAGKSTKKSTKKAAVEDEELDEEGEEEGAEEAPAAEAAPPARSKKAARAAPVPAGEFRWEDPSTLRQLDAKWILLWFALPILAVVIYGLVVSN